MSDKPGVSAPISRRRFLRNAGTALASISAAPMVLSAGVSGANERIRLGMIGMGRMMQGHVGQFLNFDDVEIRAVCDVFQPFREHAAARVNQAYSQRFGRTRTECRSYHDFRELLARDDLDAVVIATPDHWHAITAIAAAESGKDIYCEKPLSLTIHEAGEMVRAVRRYARVFQTGSQQRSEYGGRFRRACELVRSGYIGEVKTVWVGVGGPSGDCDLPPQPVPAGLDWDMWLGPAPWRPYNAVLRPLKNNTFPAWRRYRDYSGGGMTDWGAHHFDIAQWGLGMDQSGPVTILPPNGKDVPRLTYIYRNGVVMVRGMEPEVARECGGSGVLFCGTEGRIFVSRQRLRAWPESLLSVRLKPGDVFLYRSPGHHRDWINCIRRRTRPICDVDIGRHSVIVCHLGNIAYWLGRPLHWDPEHYRFVGDAAANRWLERAKREPWQV